MQIMRVDPQAVSSMQADLRAGKRTEIDHLCGLIVQLGQGHTLVSLPPSSISFATNSTPAPPAAVANVDTPVNRAVWQLVRAREQQAFAPMDVDAIYHAVYGTHEFSPRAHTRAPTRWWALGAVSAAMLACVLFWYRHRFTATHV